MTLTELSDIFNQVATAMPQLNNYHFGYLSDVNTPIINNSNPSAKCQEHYPLLLFSPPDGEYNPSSGKANRTVELWVLDRQDSDKHGTTCDTLLEKMSFVEHIGNTFLRTLQNAKNSTGKPCLKFSLGKKTAKTELDGYQLQDRLVSYKMTIEIIAPYATDCLKGFEIESVNSTDDEVVKCPTVGDCVLAFSQPDIGTPTFFDAQIVTTASMGSGAAFCSLHLYDTQVGAPSIIIPAGDLVLTYLKTEGGNTFFELLGVRFDNVPSNETYYFHATFTNTDGASCETFDIETNILGAIP